MHVIILLILSNGALKLKGSSGFTINVCLGSYAVSIKKKKKPLPISAFLAPLLKNHAYIF